MGSHITSEQRQAVIDALDNPVLAKIFVAMVEAASSAELRVKSEAELARASAALPAAPVVARKTMEEMKDALRAEDCLYDKEQIWRELGATRIPEIPATVIEEAYTKGGRVILRCSSICAKAEKVPTHFGQGVDKSYYAQAVASPEWIVVPSHIDDSTLRRRRGDVVSDDMPAPTPEDWFATLAYARLDGRREPNGCIKRYAFTTESRTLVGSDQYNVYLFWVRNENHSGDNIGAARFRPNKPAQA